jgi:hypothetical protein
VPSISRDGARRGAAWVLLLIAVVLGVLLTAVAALYAQIHCTGGDGGSPYVAGDSAQADVCSATGDGVGVLVAAVPLLVLCGRFARRLLRAWQERGRSLAAALAAAATLPLAPVVLAYAQNLPSDHCSKDDQAAYAEWLAADAQGPRPADCETY